MPLGGTYPMLRDRLLLALPPEDLARLRPPLEPVEFSGLM